jgi:hypothetical protein
MTDKDELKDVLLPEERVLWSGKPEWDYAERPKTGWGAKSGVIKFAVSVFLIISVLMAFGMLFDPEGFAGGILGVLILLSAISFVIALFNIFDKHDPMQLRHDHLYAITNNRIIIHDLSKLTTRSIMGPVLYEVSTVQNGSVHDINVNFANKEEDFATFHALSDCAAAEKLLIEKFSRRKVEQ